MVRKTEGHYVEVPELWRKDVSDPDAEEAITRLVAEHGRPADIYAGNPAELLGGSRGPGLAW